MTEISRPWAGTTIGDAGPYTAAHWWDVWQAMAAGSGALSGAGLKGVFFNVPGQLAVTYVAPNTLQVAAGAAMVDGTFYRNDNIFSATVTSATAGNVRDDRLVLRKYFSGLIQSVRIVLLPGSEAGTPGPGTPPALTQDTTRQTYWDMPLARVSITELGVITVTDERVFIGNPPPIMLNTARAFYIDPGLATQELRAEPWFLLPRSEDTYIRSHVTRIPNNAAGALAYPMLYYNLDVGGGVPPSSGDVVWTYSCIAYGWGGLIRSITPVTSVVRTIQRGILNILTPYDLFAAGCEAGDVVYTAWTRGGENMLDTMATHDLTFVGTYLEFS